MEEQGITREHLLKMVKLQDQTMRELYEKNVQLKKDKAELRDFVKMVADGDSASVDVKAFMVHAYINRAKKLLEGME